MLFSPTGSTHDDDDDAGAQVVEANDTHVPYVYSVFWFAVFRPRVIGTDMLCILDIRTSVLLFVGLRINCNILQLQF